MAFFTNKHVVIALIVAPILAVISYLFVDRLVRPDPIVAQAGQSFPLIARSNCRYDSGKCTLVNGDFKVNLLQLDTADTKPYTIEVESEHLISGFRYALVNVQGEQIQEGELSTKQFVIPAQIKDKVAAIRIALEAADVIYFAETQIAFLK